MITYILWYICWDSEFRDFQNGIYVIIYTTFWWKRGVRRGEGAGRGVGAHAGAREREGSAWGGVEREKGGA